MHVKWRVGQMVASIQLSCFRVFTHVAACPVAQTQLKSSLLWTVWSSLDFGMLISR